MASLTKPFTTTTLMTLVAEGKLSLDSPANNYLPKSKIVGTNGSADAATVRLLGAHVSGLPTMFAMFDRNEANLARSPEALLTEYGSLAYPPGSCFEYSNIGFAVLSAIGSKLTGVDIGTLMAQRVLTPLGLDDSFFGTSVARVQRVRCDTILRETRSRITRLRRPHPESCSQALTTSRDSRCLT